MSRFNLTNKSTRTTNLAGGEAYEQSPENQLVSMLLTSFLRDQAYRRSEETLAQFRSVVQSVDPEFAAKAAIYARHQFGMRSISHALAGELARPASGKPWARSFYRQVVKRPDDITEIVAYYLANYGKPLPNALKSGLAAAFDQFDQYQLAKYRAGSKQVSLVDVVNLVHPKGTESNAAALQQLVAGKLRDTETWESRVSAAGQDGGVTMEARAEIWRDMLENDKLGYMALLRNLRNIVTDAPDPVPLAAEQLTNPTRIRSSLVLPFRYMIAYQIISQIPGTWQLLSSISQAVDISAQNSPEFSGQTLIAVDTSGSMSGRPADIATLFAAMIWKRNPSADILLFDTAPQVFNPNPEDSIISVAQSMPFTGGGTDFNIIFDAAHKPYDRIIILSDMQAWGSNGLYSWSLGKGNPAAALQAYKQRTGSQPKIYSFDLQGYGSLEFPERDVYSLAGFSDKVLGLMQVLERGGSLVEMIKQTDPWSRPA